MVRAFLCSAALVGMATMGLAADNKDANKNAAKDQTQTQAKDQAWTQATVAQVDAKKNTITLKMHDKNGKAEEQTFNLTNDVKILDAHGKTAEASSFKEGDRVQVSERNGKLMEIEKERAGHRHQATITKVDAKNGTVTVQMKDKNGKEEEKTFTLTGESRYFDSTGRAAAADVFQSGNEVLVVEEEGKLVQLQQNDKNADHNRSNDHQNKSNDKNNNSNKEKSK